MGKYHQVYHISGINLKELNPYRYRGYRYDEESKYYYLNSRYYNPELGRFINADGLVGQTGDILGHNMYAYCKNNPVMMVDPSGYKSIRNWFKDKWEDFNKYLDEKPKNLLPIDVPSSSQLAHPIMYNFYGGIMSHKGEYKNIKGLKSAASFITYGTLALDLGNTWFNDKSNNTRRQRIQKHMIQVGGFGLQYAIGVGGVSLITLGAAGTIPSGTLSVGLMGVGLIIIVKGPDVVNDIQENLYEKLGIE